MKKLKFKNKDPDSAITQYVYKDPIRKKYINKNRAEEKYLEEPRQRTFFRVLQLATYQ